MKIRVDVLGLHTGKYQSGILQFGLTLYGRAGLYLPLFEKALETVGREYGIGEQGQARQFSVVGIEKITETDMFGIFDCKPRECNEVTLTFSHLKLPLART